MKKRITDYERSILEPTFSAFKYAVAMQHQCMKALKRALLVTDAEAEEFESCALANARVPLADLLYDYGITVDEPLKTTGGAE